jgi:hypothetical protein
MRHQKSWGPRSRPDYLHKIPEAASCHDPNPSLGIHPLHCPSLHRPDPCSQCLPEKLQSPFQSSRLAMTTKSSMLSARVHMAPWLPLSTNPQVARLLSRRSYRSTTLSSASALSESSSFSSSSPRLVSMKTSVAFFPTSSFIFGPDLVPDHIHSRYHQAAQSRILQGDILSVAFLSILSLG